MNKTHFKPSVHRVLDYVSHFSYVSVVQFPSMEHSVIEYEGNQHRANEKSRERREKSADVGRKGKLTSHIFD